MTRAKKRRRRKRGYPPRAVYQELHRHLAEFLDTLMPEERETFRAYILPATFSPRERLEHLQENPPPEELLVKLEAFLQERELSRTFQRYFNLGLLKVEDNHG